MNHYLVWGNTVFSISGGPTNYQQMLDCSNTQFDMFADHDEAVACFCGS